jgi:hypothetical protein
LPTPPSHRTEYRYRARADGTFSIVEEMEGKAYESLTLTSSRRRS